MNNEEVLLTEAALTGPTSASEDNSAMDLTPPVEDPDELASDHNSGEEVAPVDPLGEDEVSSSATVTGESVDTDSESSICRPIQERPRRARQRRQVLTYDRLGEPRIMRYPSLFCLEVVLTTKPAQPRRRRTRRERDASRLERMKHFSAGSNSETK